MGIEFTLRGAFQWLAKIARITDTQSERIERLESLYSAPRCPGCGAPTDVEFKPMRDVVIK